MKIVECPRDAMQGLEKFIPTSTKVAYLNQLLAVGFDTLDFGSFVSAKAIPQLRDTAEVLDQLRTEVSSSKLLAIVANARGAETACGYDKITYLGFPLSISETFQKRNTNQSIVQALETVNTIQELCTKNNKQLVCYISMGFGNPYGDPFDEGLAAGFVDLLNTLQVRIVSLADTIGVATPVSIGKLFIELHRQFPSIEFGAHLHSNPATALEKIEAAYRAGCGRFDGAIKGFGGCPMADDELVGNLATETILAYLDQNDASPSFDREAFAMAIKAADAVFPTGH